MKLQRQLLIVAILVATGCSSGGSSSSGSNGTTVTTPVAAVAAISAGIKAAGNSITTGAHSLLKGSVRPLVTAASCDVHGSPVGLTGNTDAKYPGYFTYCNMTVDSSGDTVLGAFDTPSQIGCMLTQAGVTYDGTTQTVTITDAILAACNLTNGNVPAGTVLAMTGSAPASFNSNFSNGIVVNISAFGLTFYIATNVSGTKTSFLTREVWTSGGGYTGAAAGTLDASTGNLWYERRDERGACTTNGSCGWNRHTRIHAVLTMSGSTPTGLSTISFGYSDIQYPPGQGGYAGTVVTASGDLTNGIKGRAWVASNAGNVSVQPASAAAYTTISNWVENGGTSCFTASSETATTCGAGIVGMSANTNFLLLTGDSHTSVATWFSTITGQTFTSVNMDSDTQF